MGDFFEDILNYLFGLVCLHRVSFIVATFSNLFYTGIHIQRQLFKLYDYCVISNCISYIILYSMTICQ